MPLGIAETHHPPDNREAPGQFVANGHDYRADLAAFVREVFYLHVTDAQMQRVEAALHEYELMRQQMMEGEKTEPAIEELPASKQRRRAA